MELLTVAPAAGAMAFQHRCHYLLANSRELKPKQYAPHCIEWSYSWFHAIPHPVGECESTTCLEVSLAFALLANIKL
jgi:hypothetical protein